MTTTTSTVVEMETATNVPTRLEDYVGFYGDPFVTLRDFDDDEVKPTLPITNKEITAQNPADENEANEANSIQEGEDEDEARWTEYNPPASLRTAPNLTNTVALEILQVSIENLQARAAEENQRRQLEEDEKQREAEAATANDEGDGTVKEPYLPIIITSPDGEPGPSSALETEEVDNVEDLKLFPEMTGAGEGSTLSQGLIVLPFQPKKRSRFALTRILQKIGEKDVAKKTSLFGGNSSKTSLEAAVSDEPAPTVTEKQKKAPVTVECVSCLDDFSPKKVIKVTCHSYCPDCFERLISTAVQNEQHWPPKCCLNPIPTRLYLRKISPDLEKTCKDRAAEWAIPVADRIYCAEPACGLWVRPEHVDAASRVARCREGHRSCSMCRGPHHANDADCPLDRDLALTNALAAEEGWQHCGRCQALVEHREACQHMTCRCGYQFCYVCGLRWRTCTCTMNQLELIKNGAAARRRERLRREAEAEEELRDALRQIEEFEREEALKAELLRLEMERLEEEARIAWEEERARLESLRRYEIEVRFQELRELLDQIHDLQEFLVRYQHDKEKELAANEEAMSTAELESKQEAEQRALVETAADKLAAKVKSLTAEYAARVLAEQRTEEAYLRQLESFFADRPSSEARIEVLMREFRGTMDKGWRAWERWRDEEVARYKLKVEEERTIREEIMYSVRKRHEERLERARAELERRQAAEIKWVTLVFAERMRMLDVMERAELEGEGVERNEALVGVRDDEAGSS
ncbi:IBR domain-containing protein [Colletotrichum tamarilloi]|uniref:RBR-type E3 ubiquitin transferase n=1 Tax=Colletotrichum tamarilloi TaxID=1209934 RepID=A0ABQ9R070_9PEZI|nr:IBR domain-containing protein [Colletotrichum tamarilloi]KAK1490859.1 IBR domain-containing protein [Colletotrichum tamarilloi]